MIDISDFSVTNIHIIRLPFLIGRKTAHQDILILSEQANQNPICQISSVCPSRV